MTTKPRKVVIIDVDGTICSYTESLRVFASNYLGRPLELDSKHYHTEAALGLTKGENRKISALHYMSGALARAPVYDEWIVEFVRSLYRAGVHVIILTARPSHKYPNLEQDTHDWLMLHGIGYDRLVFNADKAAYIAELDDSDDVLYAIEDTPSNAAKIADLHVLTFMPDRPYNRGAPAHSLIRRVKKAADIAEAVREFAITY